MEELVDAMSAIGLHNLAVSLLGQLLNRVAVVAEQGAGFDKLDGFLQTVSRGLHDTDVVWILCSGIADVVGLIQVSVEAAVVECNINVEDIAIFQRSVVRDTMTNDLVWTCADGLWEMAVVKWGWIGL